MRHVLVVERVDSPTTATVIYAAEKQSTCDIDQVFFVRHEATISDGVLTFTLRNGAFTLSYSIQPDGRLAGNSVRDRFVYEMLMAPVDR